jgi:uncharacterized protein involved in exopolysaccharide biosynthesis
MRPLRKLSSNRCALLVLAAFLGMLAVIVVGAIQAAVLRGGDPPAAAFFDRFDRH